MRIDNLENQKLLSEEERKQPLLVEELNEQDDKKQKLQKLSEEELEGLVGGVLRFFGL